jgi:hypothetical protein
LVSVASIALPLADANLAFFISHLRLSKMLEKMLLCDFIEAALFL